MIVERTQTGKATAKANDPNYREGRKPVLMDVPLPQLQKFREKQKDGLITTAQICSELHISRAPWFNKVKAFGL